MDKKELVLVLGGARSGKSSWALQYTETVYNNYVFLATARVSDKEMEERIRRHKMDRGPKWAVIEEPLEIPEALMNRCELYQTVLLDCLTVWIGNLMHRYSQDVTAYPEVTSFLQIAEKPPCELVIVSNELGMGIVPENEMARRFRDLAGQVNQEVARIAYKVVFMISGIPLVAKEG